MIGDDKDIEAAAVFFTPRMVAIIRLAQIDNPGDIPDLGRFLIMSAVNLAVEDPSNKGFHRYIGTNMMWGTLFYELKSGQFVAANIRPSNCDYLTRAHYSAVRRTDGFLKFETFKRIASNSIEFQNRDG